MPSEKSARASERRRVRNQSARSAVKTFVTKAEKQIAAGDLDGAGQSAVAAESALDRAVRSGVVHRNNAARRKSRLAAKLNRAQGQKTAAVPEEKAGKSPKPQPKAGKSPKPRPKAG
ncbi:MAG: 30S ribosomal protein S20 [Chloroflexota bacterium]